MLVSQDPHRKQLTDIAFSGWRIAREQMVAETTDFKKKARSDSEADIQT